MRFFERVRLCGFAHVGEAELLRSSLAQEGVHAELRGVDLLPLAGRLPLQEAEVSVWVDARDEHRARELLERLERPVHGSLRCDHCGEESPANFELCWNCQRAFP